MLRNTFLPCQSKRSENEIKALAWIKNNPSKWARDVCGHYILRVPASTVPTYVVVYCRSHMKNVSLWTEADELEYWLL